MDLQVPGYEIIGPIGRGGFASVHRARQISLDREVAIKVVEHELDPEGIARFQREARLIGRLSQRPGILPVYEASETPAGYPYLTMAVASHTLADVIERDGAVAWPEAVRIGVALAATLDMVHAEGILHRDIKPGNVFFDEAGAVLLGDFGIAQPIDAVDGEAGMIIGTIPYMPPELIEGGRPDARSDLYSLAATLFAALTGSAPHVRSAGESVVAIMSRIMGPPPELRDEVAPLALRQVVRKGLARFPDDRYPTGDEMARALRRVRPWDDPETVTDGNAVDLPIRHGFRYIQQAQASDEILPWLGHGGLVERLADRLLHADGGAYLITGFRGIGKSTVVARTLAAVGEGSGGPRIVPIHLNVARPLESPHSLLVDTIRILYEVLAETGELADLGEVGRRTLELAYTRTAVALVHRDGRTRGASGTVPLGPASLGVNAGRSTEVERAFNVYSESDIEHDFLRIARLLRHEGRGRSGRRRRGRSAVQPIQLIVIFDELDKLTSTLAGRDFLSKVLRELKNVLSAPHVHFIFTAGPDVQEDMLAHERRGSSDFDSTFSLHLYVPVLWTAADNLVATLTGLTGAAEGVSDLSGALRLRSRGVTRRLLRSLNDLVAWPDGRPALRLTSAERELMALHGRVDAVVAAAVTLASDEVPGTLPDDRIRLAGYVVADWILGSTVAQYTVEQAHVSLFGVDPEGVRSPLEPTIAQLGSMFEVFASERILHRSAVLATDVAPTFSLHPDLRRELVALAQLPRRVGAADEVHRPPAAAPGERRDPAGIGEQRPGVVPAAAYPPTPPASAFGAYTAPPPAPAHAVYPGPPAAPGHEAYPAAPSRFDDVPAGAPARAWPPPPPAWSGATLTGPLPGAAPGGGSTLGGGRYVLTELVGAGGFGSTYRGRDLVTNRDVLIRLFDRPEAAAHVARERFRREVRLLAGLSHPHIQRALEVVEEPDGRIALISDLAFGPTLEKVIDDGGLAEAEARAVALQLLDLLTYLHANDVRRVDFVPQTLVLTERGIVLTELSAARRFREDATVLTAEPVNVGALAYTAPEVRRGEEPSTQSDIYAVGVLLFQLVGGVLETGGRVDVAVRPDQVSALPVSAQLRSAIIRATAAGRDGRFATIGEFRSALGPRRDQNAGETVVLPARRTPPS